MHVLAQSRARVNAYDARYGTAIQAATQAGRSGIIEGLIQGRANMLKNLVKISRDLSQLVTTP